MNGVAMATFTIDSENNIAAHAGLPANAESQSFSNLKELASLTSDWPISRLVDTWNSFAGVVPFDDLKRVKKFTDRNAAVARIWKAIARLSPDARAQAGDVAPPPAKPKNRATNAKRRDTARLGAKRGAPTGKEGSKKDEVLEMMRRTKGATLTAIMEKTGWQAHTVRGFVSGTLIKKLGIKVESFKTEAKERAYRVIS